MGIRDGLAVSTGSRFDRPLSAPHPFLLRLPFLCCELKLEAANELSPLLLRDKVRQTMSCIFLSNQSGAKSILIRFPSIYGDNSTSILRGQLH